MTALTNPFDILPAGLFNLLGSPAGPWQRHYAAILLRIYQLAEFNRFGLTREVVLAEIADYLAGAGADVPQVDGPEDEPAPAVIADRGRQHPHPQDDGPEDEPAPAGDRTQTVAGWVLRRLVEAGWLEREQQADYTEMIVLPDYAFTLLEALRTIQEQKPREYSGQLYAAHQLLTKEGDDFSPALALTQACENVRQVVRGLSELNQNIRRYTERAGRNRSVPELLRLQYDDYTQVLGPAYHALKTSDHVSRYRRGIVGRLQGWQTDPQWLDQTADELATQTRLTPAQAAGEVQHAMRFVIDQLEGLDPLLEEIDRRHAQYLRTSLRQVRYQLVSADGSFKDRLVALARGLAALRDEGEEALPTAMPSFQWPEVRQPDADSLYTLPRRRPPLVANPVDVRLLDPADERALRAVALQEVGLAITPARIQRFVGQFFNGHRTLHVRELPAEAFAREQDLPWLVYTIAYGNHPDVGYTLEPLPGEPVPLGLVWVQPFQLVKR